MSFPHFAAAPRAPYRFGRWPLSALGLAAVLAGCTTVVEQPVAVRAAPPVVAAPAVVEPGPVVSVYVDPPLVQPPAVLVPWAPPPLLVQAPPPPPFADAIWVGGYWAWQERWVWSAGYWDRPPHPGYTWCEPYYEHRGGAVVFVNGFWAAPGIAFVPPAPTLHLSLSITLAGAVGLAPIGPAGVFVPAPPGSRLGLIVPAPIGTAPGVVTAAPAIVREGMRVTNNIHVVNNVTQVTEINRTVNQVTIEAPASATANHQAFHGTAPARAALAAAAPPLAHWQAPLPQSRERIKLAPAGQAPVALPAAQPVHVLRAGAEPRPPTPQARMPEPRRPEPLATLPHEERAVNAPAHVERAATEPERARAPQPAKPREAMVESTHPKGIEARPDEQAARLPKLDEAPREERAREPRPRVAQARELEPRPTPRAPRAAPPHRPAPAHRPEKKRVEE